MRPSKLREHILKTRLPSEVQEDILEFYKTHSVYKDPYPFTCCDCGCSTTIEGFRLRQYIYQDQLRCVSCRKRIQYSNANMASKGKSAASLASCRANLALGRLPSNPTKLTDVTVNNTTIFPHIIDLRNVLPEDKNFPKLF